jgi:hypothetical protein
MLWNSNGCCNQEPTPWRKELPLLLIFIRVTLAHMKIKTTISFLRRMDWELYERLQSLYVDAYRRDLNRNQPTTTHSLEPLNDPQLQRDVLELSHQRYAIQVVLKFLHNRDGTKVTDGGLPNLHYFPPPSPLAPTYGAVRFGVRRVVSEIQGKFTSKDVEQRLHNEGRTFTRTSILNVLAQMRDRDEILQVKRGRGRTLSIFQRSNSVKMVNATSMQT